MLRVIKARALTIEQSRRIAMFKSLLGVASVFCFVGCSSDALVGGPYGDSSGGSSGSAAMPSAGAGSAGMTAAGASAGGASAAGAPSQSSETPRDAARAYAKKATACQTDADCCLVVDNCLDQGLIVGVADKDKVRSLLDSADMSQCLGCIPPFVQVSCEQSVCVGTSVDLQQSSSGSLNNALVMDHCGTVQTPDFVAGAKGTVLGCGG